MDIPLNTIFEWEIIGLNSPSQTILCLDRLLLEGDILVIVSYEPPQEATLFLEQHSVKLGRIMDRFNSTIEMNRREYPQGRAFALPVTSPILRGLAIQVSSCGYDYDLFIDHLIAFRLSKPVLPLFFHDKLRHGYPMMLSGHYDQATVRAFCRCAGGEFIRKRKGEKEEESGDDT